MHKTSPAAGASGAVAGSGVPRGRYNAGVACADAPATHAPGRPAVIHEGGGSTTTLTFAELASRSSALARHLRAGGVGRGDSVGVFAAAGTDAAIAHIAVLKAGAVTLPLVPLLGEDAILHRLSDAGARTVVVTRELSGDLDRLLVRHPGEPTVVVVEPELLSDPPGAPPFEVAPTAPDDPALLIYTSGTTGKAKGVLAGHGILLARHAPMAMIHGPFASDDVFWSPVDWMWVGSFVDAVLTPLSYGCTVMTYERRRFLPDEAIERIKAFGVTRAFIPPTALRQLMDGDAGRWRGHRLRSIHSGGEQLTAAAAEWALDTLRIAVDEIYGMTEASFVAGGAQRFYPAHPGSLGRPYPGQSLRVVDDEGRDVAPDAIGELVVSVGSPSMFLGYHGQPELTASRFRDGWFTTGDLVRGDEAGRLFYVGRKDELIMTSGHRVGPGEIEDALRGHRHVRDVVVVGEPDPERGHRIKAIVQLEPGDGAAGDLTTELQDLVRLRVGRHAYPRSVEYVADFPRTVTGKVRRDLLRRAPDPT